MTPTAARVIYPELPDPLTPRDLQHLFSQSFDERQWAPTVTRTIKSQVALLVQLKIFQTIGRFLRADDIPPAATDHVAHRMGMESGSNLTFPDRTLSRHRQTILKRLKVVSWGAEARALAHSTMENAAPQKTLDLAVASNPILAIPFTHKESHMLKIYGVPISVHTRKAIVVAIAKQLPHEVVPVVPVIPNSPPPNWRELSPAGKVPALTDGDFVVSDSAAICAYLERLRPEPSFYPHAPQTYAQALSLEQYAGTLFREAVQPLFHEVFVHPKVHNIPTNQEKVNTLLATAVPEMFRYLDSIATEDYLVGSSFSIADISIVSNLVNYQYIGFDIYRDEFPRLAALFDRTIRQPAVREALRREQPVVDSMGLRREFLSEIFS